MIGIEKPEVKFIGSAEDSAYGTFVVEPLERGFGTTLGNSLRRVLLSSLPGVAVTSVKIENINHEFSTIPGVKEDVTEIILNVKGLIAKMYCDCPKTVYIEAEGEGVVTAADIEQDADIEIFNPELVICNLAEGGSINMEMTISNGRGYVRAEENKKLFEKN